MNEMNIFDNTKEDIPISQELNRYLLEYNKSFNNAYPTGYLVLDREIECVRELYPLNIINTIGSTDIELDIFWTLEYLIVTKDYTNILNYIYSKGYNRVYHFLNDIQQSIYTKTEVYKLMKTVLNMDNLDEVLDYISTKLDISDDIWDSFTSMKIDLYSSTHFLWSEGKVFAITDFQKSYINYSKILYEKLPKNFMYKGLNYTTCICEKTFYCPFSPSSTFYLREGCRCSTEGINITENNHFTFNIKDMLFKFKEANYDYLFDTIDTRVIMGDILNSKDFNFEEFISKSFEDMLLYMKVNYKLGTYRNLFPIQANEKSIILEDILKHFILKSSFESYDINSRDFDVWCNLIDLDLKRAKPEGYTSKESGYSIGELNSNPYISQFEYYYLAKSHPFGVHDDYLLYCTNFYNKGKKFIINEKLMTYVWNMYKLKIGFTD